MSTATVHLARLARSEAEVLADAVEILSRVEQSAARAGWTSESAMSAMRYGKVAQSAATAGREITQYLICASVYTGDLDADYALHRDDEPEATDDEKGGDDA